MSRGEIVITARFKENTREEELWFFGLLDRIAIPVVVEIIDDHIRAAVPSRYAAEMAALLLKQDFLVDVRTV